MEKRRVSFEAGIEFLIVISLIFVLQNINAVNLFVPSYSVRHIWEILFYDIDRLWWSTLFSGTSKKNRERQNFR